MKRPRLKEGWSGEGEPRWRAVLARDARRDGEFVYAVRSTGIYCCPSCPSRRPHRSRVLFFRHPAEAEQAGFRACKRCHPKTFEELQEKERMSEELRLAREIQARLQPAPPPALEGWEICGASSPCREIGGDYYDFIRRPQDGQLIIAAGDIAGKGAGAAILMASLHAAVRIESQNGASVGEVMREINRYIYENSPSDKFLTLFYGKLDPVSGRLEYSNAGHPPPLVARRSGEIVPLEAGGVPIGIFPDTAFEQRVVTLQPGDVLVLYTDGIREAMREDGEEFGESRLVECVTDGRECSAAELGERIESALRGFLLTDDRTLVVVKRTAAEESLLQESDRFEARPALSLV
ncbi:MAG: SpoIIE family protein phosphatase [Candidatus Acidiferrales bacterium]